MEFVVWSLIQLEGGAVLGELEAWKGTSEVPQPLCLGADTGCCMPRPGRVVDQD